jgi:cobalamin biosynthesis protein CobT
MRNRYSVTVTSNNQHLTTLDFDGMGAVARHLIDNEASMEGQQVHVHQITHNGVARSLPRLIDTFTVGYTK